MVKISVNAIQKMRNSGYTVTEEGDTIIIYYTPPSINEAMSSNEEVDSLNRYIEIIGKKNDDQVIITEAYIIEGNIKKRKLDESELELWAEYVGE